MNYSHPALVSITGDLATYHFENIELPATGANKGYITYAIRPKKELVKGDTIPNKADIYFDFNFPIATNRHTLTLVVPNGSNEIIEEPVNLYPNPASTGFYISAAKISSITICDLIGNEVYKNHNPDSFVSFDLPNGGYLVNITLSNGLMVKRKLVVVR
ncbi:MAG: T9SS type A sorting domain-containing protein [Saprospiraceae bacterium]|nr:T9SS type A sorting domain-containing protein [Saprospiraceae bacterium]